MKRKKVYRNCLIAVFFLNLFVIGITLVKVYQDQIPASIKLLAGKEAEFDFDIPASAVIYQKNATSIQEKKVDLKHPFTLSSRKTGSYVVNVKLWGMLHLKQVDLDVIEQKEVVPCGNPIGIYIKTKGVMVIDTQTLTDVDGMSKEPAKNILKAGDYIRKVNGEAINSKDDLMNIVNEEGDSPVVLTISRESHIQKVKVEPVKVKEDHTYKIGVWVRDNAQGIGTLTYIDQEHFGALGHGIHDVDTGNMMTVSGGFIYDSKILSLVKGKNGEPGEIVGMVCYDEEHPFGSIEKNTNYGIYGEMKEDINSKIRNEKVEIGLKQEVKKGKAYIRSSISGETKDYEIQIEEVDRSNKNYAKGMVIKITDPELLKMTNGIIQGMSGTPILQNGKLIGAVTHVFVQDSKKGYGTFIENMLRESNGD